MRRLESPVGIVGHLTLAFLVGSLVPAPAPATAILYTNDFEAPSGSIDTTGRDVSQQNVSTLYNLAGFSFQQINTVETRLDISAIDLDGVGGPFGVAQPVFRRNLYNSPGGVFN